MRNRLILICAFCLFGTGLCAADLILKDGSTIKDVRMASKNQFGINILHHKDEKTGKEILQFIRFFDLSVASFRYFPYCDAKTNERIVTSLSDRIAMASKRYQAKIKEMDESRDYAKLASVPGGVATVKVLFLSEKMLDNGTIGWAYSDATEGVLYGKFFLSGLLVAPGQIFVGPLQIVNSPLKLGNETYGQFVFQAPPSESLPEPPQLSDDKPKKASGKQGSKSPVHPPKP